MKRIRSGFLLVAVIVATMGVFSVSAEEAAGLTRAQWLKKIGACVTQEAVLRETLAQVLPEERVEFTQRVMKAVRRMPKSPAEKAAIFVRTAVACIASAKGDLRYKVIAEVFAGTPVEYLPFLMEELSKRFNQEYNGLSNEAYKTIASEVIKAAVARNAQTEEPSVRNTFVLLAFLRGAKDPSLEATLLGLLPDARMRSLVQSWLGPALNNRNYEGLLAAADVEQTGLPDEARGLSLAPGDGVILPQLRPGSARGSLSLVGHSQLERLLADLVSDSEQAAFFGNVGFQSIGIHNRAVGVGINRLPLPYQNQTSSVR